MLKFYVKIKKKTKFCPGMQTQKVQVQKKKKRIFVTIVTELCNSIVKMFFRIRIPVQ